MSFFFCFHSHFCFSYVWVSFLAFKDKFKKKKDCIVYRPPRVLSWGKFFTHSSIRSYCYVFLSIMLTMHFTFCVENLMFPFIFSPWPIWCPCKNTTLVMFRTKICIFSFLLQKIRNLSIVGYFLWKTC